MCSGMVDGENIRGNRLELVDRVQVIDWHGPRSIVLIVFIDVLVQIVFGALIVHHALVLRSLFRSRTVSLPGSTFLGGGGTVNRATRSGSPAPTSPSPRRDLLEAAPFKLGRAYYACDPPYNASYIS